MAFDRFIVIYEGLRGFGSCSTGCSNPRVVSTHTSYDRVCQPVYCSFVHGDNFDPFAFITSLNINYFWFICNRKSNCSMENMRKNFSIAFSIRGSSRMVMVAKLVDFLSSIKV